MQRRTSVASAVARYLISSLVAIAVIVVGSYFVLRSVTIDEAERDTRQRVILEGRLVQTGLTDGVLTGDPVALAKLDELVQGQILGEAVMRVKVWTRDGRILYSDEPRLIGDRFGLGAEELFETYQRFGAVSASASRILSTLAPPLLGGLLVLLLVQVPLAYGLARRLQRGHDERERLLAGAIEASDNERRRIAADLHDGIVHDLAGVAFGLAPVAANARPAEQKVLNASVERLRQGVRELRTLLVEIHPPRLERAGLDVALDDLLSPLRAAGVETELDVELGGPNDPLVYRVAREALRNVAEHAQATHVTVSVTPTTLTVRDDGRGFDAAQRARSREDGHVGLALLEDLVREAGGTLAVTSAPGTGTLVVLELRR